MATNVFNSPFNTNTNTLMTNAANSRFIAQQPTQGFGLVNLNSNAFSNPSNINNQTPFATTTFSNQQGNNFSGNNLNTQQGFTNNNQSGLFGNKTSNNPALGSNFGNQANQFNNNAFNTAPNSFIPNTFATSNNMANPSFSTPTKQKFQPRRSKNEKLDSKNLVKSISLLDQNVGLSLKQIRLKYINMQANGNIGLTPSLNSFGFGAQNTQNPTAGFNLNQNQNIINGFNSNTSFLGNTGNNQQNTFGAFGGPPALSPSRQIGFNNNSSNNTNAFGITSNNIVSTNNYISNSPFGGTSAFAPAFGNSLSSNTNNNSTNFANKTGLFAPTGNNSVFPSSKPTQPTFGQNLTNTNNQPLNTFSQNQPNSFEQTFANAALTLATSANINLNSAPQAYNNNFFGSMPNYDQTKTQLMLTNSLFQSDFFRDMIKSNLSHSDNTSQQFLTDKTTKNQRLFNLFDENQDNYVQDKLFGSSQFKKSKPIKGSIKDQKQLIKFYQKPYFFNESYSNYNRKASQQVLQHKFQIKKLPPSKNKPILQILKQTPLTQFQQSYDKLQKKLQKQFNTKNQDLPINDCGLKITPNIDKICSMSTKQIKEISNVTFQNAYGKITFLGPISLYRKRLSECIEINRDSVQVKEKDWQKVRCRVVQQNFGGYLETSQAQKKKFMKKMLRWADKNLLRILNFDTQTGEIIYQANF